MNIKFYLCENSGYPLYEQFKNKNSIKQGSWEVIRVPCCGKIEKDKLLDDLNNGTDKIVIIPCFDGSCRYVNGNARCGKRVESLKEDFEKLGLNKNIIELHPFTPSMTEEFMDLMSGY
jgi:coenzyme F420-reducing hydrogenase delta subunit